jgi:DNA-binding LytR/AlgR family response regulator
MLDIAICDDDPDQLAGYVSEFIQSDHHEAVVHQFHHPDDLLNFIVRKRCLIYILDIVIPMVNGIEVGKAISFNLITNHQQHQGSRRSLGT